MILKVGSQTFEDAQVKVAIHRIRTVTQRGYPNMRSERWDLEFFVHAATQAALTTALGTLETNIVNNVNVYLNLSDGTTESAHKIVTADTIGGTRIVIAPSFPARFGAEYAAGLTAMGRFVRVRIEADYDLSVAAGEPIKTWFEMVEAFSSGLGEFVVQTPLEGVPIRQEVSEFTPVRLVQQGFAVRFDAYPTPPEPLFPSHEHPFRRRPKRHIPKEANGSFYDYRQDWYYEMEKADGFGDVTPNREP